MNKYVVMYRFTITFIFIYIFIQFLTMKRTNFVYKFYSDYIMNKYCIILYILMILLVMRYDSYTAILLFILVIIPFKFVYKEYFKSLESFADLQTTKPNTKPNTIPNITRLQATNPQSTTPQSTTPKTTTPKPTIPKNTTPQNLLSVLIQSEYLNIDDRFKMDEIAKDEILKQIAAQIKFDPYKTNLGKDVINEIYSKYFDNDIFKKLTKSVDDSQQYIASGNFTYLPKNNKVDYDLITYQNLSTNTQLGINPITDGIKNLNSRSS